LRSRFICWEKVLAFHGPALLAQRERLLQGDDCWNRHSGLWSRVGDFDDLLVALHDEVDVPLQQPIPFSHKHHVTDDGIDSALN
jgi:hypothetical protein